MHGKMKCILQKKTPSINASYCTFHNIAASKNQLKIYLGIHQNRQFNAWTESLSEPTLATCFPFHSTTIVINRKSTFRNKHTYNQTVWQWYHCHRFSPNIHIHILAIFNNSLLFAISSIIVTISQTNIPLVYNR